MRNLSVIGLIMLNQLIMAQEPFQVRPLNTVYNNFAHIGNAEAYLKTAGTNFGSRPDLKGSPYLFGKWVKGRIINNNDQIYFDGLYNFDKVNQQLLWFINDSVFAIDKESIKSAYLSDGELGYTLEKIPGMKKNTFYKVIMKGKVFSLYSFINTTFVKADYKTNGIVGSGNPYDEYKDEDIYYIVVADRFTSFEVSLKKKSIRKALEKQTAVVEEYFKAHPGNIDEKYLVALLKYLNDRQ
ncbi:MAG: hypothetical protein C4308_04190 [Chitinophagaceae bacterium]